MHSRTAGALLRNDKSRSGADSDESSGQAYVTLREVENDNSSGHPTGSLSVLTVGVHEILNEINEKAG